MFRVELRIGIKELTAAEDRRLTRLPEGEGARLEKLGTPMVPLRMRLEHKKNGRREGRLIVQGFREPVSWDVGGKDPPTCALASIRTLLFIIGRSNDIISSIDVSTAFLQSDEYKSTDLIRYVY